MIAILPGIIHIDGAYWASFELPSPYLPAMRLWIVSESYDRSAFECVDQDGRRVRFERRKHISFSQLLEGEWDGTYEASITIEAPTERVRHFG